jgi:PQQ-dependent dehydrogenase (methanol/ethanol family)
MNTDPAMKRPIPKGLPVGTIAAALALALTFACATVAADAPSLPAPPASAAPPDDGQWPMAAKNYAATRFSELNEVDQSSVKHLQVAFTFSTGVPRGQEAAPIIVDNTLYIVSAYPNNLFALDLTKPGAPLKWEFKPQPEAASQGVACCDVVNRGAVYWKGKIIINTLDGNTIAVDASTGQQIWRTQLADIHKGESITMAPLVVKDKVLVGDSGGEFGVRGWLTALDVDTGKIAWRAYHTGPDKDVLIGDEFKPFYASDRGKDLGVTTWPPDAWKIGGGSMWGWIAYDPDRRWRFSLCRKFRWRVVLLEARQRQRCLEQRFQERMGRQDA